MAAFMLLLQFVVYENSFDEFHQMSLKQEPIPLIYRYFPASDDYFTMTVDPKTLKNILLPAGIGLSDKYRR